MSNLSAFPYIPENSQATPGLWNYPLSIISANIAAIDSGLTSSSPSGNTFSFLTNIETSGGAHFQFLSIGSTPPSYVTTAAITIAVNSNTSDYLYLTDSSAQRSNYVIGSRAGGTADGLNIWDASGATPIVTLSKQSAKFYVPIISSVFDTGGQLFNVLAYGARGDGSHDDAPSIQLAINSATTGVVFFPPGIYKINSGLTCYTPLTIQGSGYYSILSSGASLTSGAMLTISRSTTSSLWWNSENQLDGCVVQNLRFRSNRATGIEGLRLAQLDHAFFANLWFEAIKGPGLHLASEVRECLFQGLSFRWCGSSSTNAALLLDDDDPNGAEGHNTLKFLGIQSALNHGSALLVDTTLASSRGNLNRRARFINFIGLHFEGPQLGSSDFNGASFPDADLQNPLVVLNDCQDISFMGGATLTAGQGASHFSVNGSGNTGAHRVRLIDLRVAGHAALSSGTVTTFDDGIRIAGNASEVFLHDVSMPTAGRDVVVPSTGSLKIGLNCQLSGASESIDSRALQTNYLSGTFTPWFNQPLNITGASTLSSTDFAASVITAQTRLRVQGNATATGAVTAGPGTAGGTGIVSLGLIYGSYADTDATIQVESLAANGRLYKFVATGSGSGNVNQGFYFYDGTGGFVVYSVSSGGALSWGTDGISTVPALTWKSETSLGFYRSAVSTIAQSFGTFDLTAAIASLGTVRIKSGANNSCGTAVLGSNGSVNVANTYVKTGDLIFLTDQSPGGTLGDLELGGIRNSSGFTIQSTSITDTSTVGWLIIRPG